MNQLETRCRIFLVDDHPMMRDGLSMRITAQPGWEICGMAATEDEGVTLITEQCPDLVLVDISLGSGNGIDLIKRVLSKNPTVKFLAISAYKESLYAERAMRAGALGYLNKQESNEKLIEAIRTVLKGERFLSDALQARLVASALGRTSVEHEPTERLSDREKEIFRLIGEGLTTGAIADQLLLSTHTIDTHREHLKRKLNVGTAAELSRLAFHSMIENT
ncbi:response regulator [Neorhodopirellula pilleata]|uniref:Oxygen regulatory protein NreC n=1 Tax=Neorhodopirellula pilleata TaxID=2714738 RepID=A0A5C6AKS3_9BACT|nr:response regulator transcription factor [Neorhodopirellula pilleata]TWT98783.1 Oxygen regulatory protein NreC [Neorhodopirellula pilleata]